MQCVASVRFFIKRNGEHQDYIKPTKGLCQGDLLSSYLFLFVADGLVNFLNKEVPVGRITPVKVARNSPGVSNLLFADDSMLFFKASVDQVITVKNVLQVFHGCTGQLLSSSKCSILFSEQC